MWVGEDNRDYFILLFLFVWLVFACTTERIESPSTVGKWNRGHLGRVAGKS